MRQAAVDLDPRDHAYLLLADAYRTCKLEPDLYRAIGDASRALELVTENGGSFIEVMAHFYLGVALTAVGAVEAGEQVMRRSNEMSIRIREDFGTVVTHLTLGLNLVSREDPALREEARKIAAHYVGVGHVGPAMHGLCHHILGQALLTEGDLVGAEAELRQALADFSALPPSRLLIVPLLAQMWLEQGRVAEAHELCEAALAFIEAQGGLGHCDLPVRLAATAARLADGDGARARDAVMTAASELRRRADAIEDADLRRMFLDIAEHRRIVALADASGAWL